MKISLRIKNTFIIASYSKFSKNFQRAIFTTCIIQPLLLKSTSTRLFKLIHWFMLTKIFQSKFSLRNLRKDIKKFQSTWKTTALRIWKLNWWKILILPKNHTTRGLLMRFSIVLEKSLITSSFSSTSLYLLMQWKKQFKF